MPLARLAFVFCFAFDFYRILRITGSPTNKYNSRTHKHVFIIFNGPVVCALAPAYAWPVPSRAPILYLFSYGDPAT